MIRAAPMVQSASVIQTAVFGTYQRRLAVATKTASGIAGTMTPPVLWVLLIAPALDTALGTSARTLTISHTWRWPRSR